MTTAPLILAFALAASPATATDRADAELAAGVRMELAIVLDATGVRPLGGQEILDLRIEAAKMLKSKYPPVRRAGCRALNRFGTVDHIPALKVVLRDENDQVASRAACALGAVGDKRVIPALITAFMRDGPETKEGCIVAIVAIDKRTGERAEAIRALKRMYRWSIKTNHPNDSLRIRQTLERMTGAKP